MELIQPLLYGFCLLIILHMISEMRQLWRTKIIIVGKIDLFSAFCRVNIKFIVTSTFIDIVKYMALIFLNIPFGNTPLPLQYTTILKSPMVLVNGLPQAPTWYPNTLK